MPTRRLAATLQGDGHIRLVEQDVPQVKAGQVLVQVHASLVSPGSEFRGGWRALCEQRDKPRSGVEPQTFGYANAGVVVETGVGVERFSVGDRVACMGAGYALHANFAVAPHHLCVALPDNVTFAQGSYAHLASTAIHTSRRGEPQLGEFVGVIGLGLIGQLSARMYQLSGCYVAGWNTIAKRREIASGWGIDSANSPAEQPLADLTREFTAGAGLDAAVIAFGGDATGVIDELDQCLKVSPDGHTMGRIVIVGGAGYTFTHRTTNHDIRIAARTGPGYHDELWEHGDDYPPVFMRWTTRTNLELCVRLIHEGKLNVDTLTTHSIDFSDVERQVDAILDEPDDILGVVFEY